MSTMVLLMISLLGFDPQFELYVEKALSKPALPFSLVYEARSLFTTSLQSVRECFEMRSDGTLACDKYVSS